MTSPLEQKALEIISQIQGLAPAATKIALQTAQIEAMANLFFGFIFAAIVGGIVLFWLKIYAPWTRRGDMDSVDGPIANFAAGAVLVIASFVCGLVALNYLADIFNYVGVFHPELFLAHKTL